MVKAKASESENRKTMEKCNETKVDTLKRSVELTSSKMTKGKNIQITDTRNESGPVVFSPAGVQWTIWKSHG